MTTKLLESPVNSKGITEHTWVLENRGKIDEKNEGGDYEKISIKGTLYYFNTINYKIFSIKKKYVGRIEKGEILFK